MPELNQNPPEDGNTVPTPDFKTLDEKDALATLSWYLVFCGIMAIVLAAVCLYLDRTGSREFFQHKDFALNPNALGRMLLMAGIALYAAGRGIVYYRRFKKRASG